MNFYPHHIGDFNNATRHLTRVERSLYRDLIELYYDTEHPLIGDDFDKLAKRVLAVSDEEKSALRDILSEFFVLEAGKYTHSRCDEELAKYHANTENKRKAGKASASARKQNSTPVEQTLNKCATNQEPRTKNQEPIKEESKTKQAPDKPAFVLPDWIDSEKWALWLKTRKKKMIPEQMQAQVNKLDRWRQSGLDHKKALADAADAGWQGLQEPKSAQKNGSIHDERAHTIAELTGRNREKSGDIQGSAVRVD